ncbi:histidinol-phosphate transaminase [Actinoallomurus spadix]|uniref:Histidinol-phosphate aminotransferase n=2 Tax=Actinoallomurus spadix TaxID=79912 RepID=A0ABP3GQP2_9ACTN
MTLAFVQHLAGLPAYTAAKRPEAGRAYARLAANESPYEPLPGVAEALTLELGRINRYPDSHSGALRERLAEHYDVSADQFVVATGSVALLGQVLRLVVGAEDDEILFPWRSFEAYPVFSRLSGGRPVPVPLKDHGLDLDGILDHIGPRTKAIFLCNPNNPTGSLLSPEEIRAFCRAVPEHILVVLDEAYAEFVNDDAIRDVSILGEHTNVCILRTFSKAYGLAGLRIGYAIASREVAGTLRTAAVPFAANSLGQAAAAAALGCQGDLRDRLAGLRAERRRVIAALRGRGLGVPESHANFVWLPLGDLTPGFAAHCEAQGVLVRPYTSDGCRVTIATPSDNDLFLAAVDSWPEISSIRRTGGTSDRRS